MNPLIQVAELQNLLDSATTAPLVLDVRFTLGRHDGREAYERGHIPGSHWVDLENDLAGPPTPGRAGRHPLPNAQDFTAAMRVAGVSNDSTVVITDADNALAASRLWWMLTDAGHTDVRVLDGGFRAWTAAGSDVAEGPDTLPNPETSTPAPANAAWSKEQKSNNVRRGAGSLTCEHRNVTGGNPNRWTPLPGTSPEPSTCRARRTSPPRGVSFPQRCCVVASRS